MNGIEMKIKAYVEDVGIVSEEGSLEIERHSLVRKKYDIRLK